MNTSESFPKFEIEQRDRSPDSIQAIIFDFDGTIANTYPSFLTIFSNEVTKKVSFVETNIIQNIAKNAFKDEVVKGNERQRPQILLLKVLYKTCRMLGLKKWQSLYSTLNSAYKIKKNYENVSLFPGVAELLEFLHEQGIPLILITHSSKKTVLNILKKNGLDIYFTIILDRSDIGADKTTGIRQALEALGIDPNNAIAIGDLPADIAEAKSLGLKTVAFFSNYNIVDRDIIESFGPDYTVESHEQLKSVLTNSGIITEESNITI